ncbi:MAG: M23 family metallopeptidase [Bacteroidia bacterium]|nr:M23 family metallopeptidase [Bacteroidia bacterium]MBT8309880.1 M23 family metallopeptidase [Bacteroidia bacterium]NNK27665.1 M23 family metallopeptidase [Flavobacteriaceae bacterium]NNL62143.1 M23 family metallopeptidase [Flavobacteriaceae bacterium]
MRILGVVFLLCHSFGIAQSKYPQDYFRKPLDIPLVLSGTFAELRSNHFHSGLDIKTKQREGLKVYASAPGYVSRIKISHWGYGKALYITHPNGYTSVYAHLQKFSEKIEEYVKEKQYEKESFTLELFPSAEELQIESDEIVAFSGNTGGSGGPHLHFEIRDNKERPMNPMLFGIDVDDTKKPRVIGVFAYPENPISHVNQSNERQELRLIPQKNGDYKVEKIKAFGKIGFGVVAWDRQDLAANKNGVSNIQSFYNGNRNLEIDFSRFSFSETSHLNRLIDYQYYQKKKSRIQKLFIEPNNPLSLYKNIDNDGYVFVEDSTSSVYKLRIKDFQGNDSWVTIPIEGVMNPEIVPISVKVTDHFIKADQSNTFNEGNFSVYFPNDCFYDDFHMDFGVSNDTLTLHESVVPVKKSFTINYDISNYKEEDKSKLFIARLVGYRNQYLSYSYTRRKGDVLSTKTKNLGKYVLGRDTENPKISAVNFSDGKWLSKYRYLKVKINDDLSGIRNYRATVNGKWILMEYNAKKGILTHDFNDNIVNDTKNLLKIIVTDNVGNSSTFEATFFRK